ncbi:hypothetical protein Tco_0690022 [Tanacetum coccineum]
METPDTPLIEKLVLDDKLEKKTGSLTALLRIEWSFDHVQINCHYHQRKRMVSGNNYNMVNYDYYTKTSHLSAHKNMVPRAVLLKYGLTPLNTARPVNTVMGQCYTVRPRAVNTARPYIAPVNAVRAKRVNAVKTLAC